MTYDSSRGRTMLFGGFGITALNQQALLDDTWEFDGISWRLMATPSAPSARFSHTMTYDATTSCAILYGGRSSNAVLSDAWRFHGQNWVPLLAPAITLEEPSSCYDYANGRVVISGSSPQSTSNPSTSRMIAFDGQQWQVLPAPSNGRNHQVVYDWLLGNVLAIDNDGCGIQTLAGTTWSALPMSNPCLSTPAGGWQACYDPTNLKVVLFGGLTFLQHHSLPPSCESLGSTETFLLEHAHIARFVRHGIGCTTTGTTPILGSAPNTTPALGTTFPLLLNQLPTSPGIAIVAVGTDLLRSGAVALPLDLGQSGLPGCRLWVDPIASLPLLYSGAGAATNLSLPAHQAFAGLVLGVQALVLDSASPNGIGSVTNGALLRLY